MKKRITVIFCIILILFNFICGSSYATESKLTSMVQDFTRRTSPKDLLKNIQDDNATIKSNDKDVPAPVKDNDDSKTVAMYITGAIAFIVEWINNIPQIIVEAVEGDLDLEYFTIFDLVTGKYEFFNMNFSNIKDSKNYKSSNAPLGDVINSKIITFYYILKNISTALILLILIYIGIRMAISTVSSDRVKYKKMFINWAASLVLLQFMHIIIIAISFITNFALEYISKLAVTFKIDNIEELILQGSFATVSKSSGWNMLPAVLAVIIFVYYELKFFLAYVYRVMEITVLATISPLVTITYSIDKVGDNKAQAFRNWFSELSIKYFVQVVHAITYCIFIGSAGEIAQEVPIFAVLFLFALDRAEKVFRNVLNVREDRFQKIRVPIFDRHKK